MNVLRWTKIHGLTIDIRNDEPRRSVCERVRARSAIIDIVVPPRV
jgi:hypothetical protein